MPRYIVIWNPGFEFGMSRMGIIDSLKTSWVKTGSPQMAERRKLKLVAATDEDLLKKISAWFMETWQKSMKKTVLNVVTIEDSEWDKDEQRWKDSYAALTAGLRFGPEKPQFCLLMFEKGLAQKG